MKKRSSRLLIRLFWIYVGVAVFGIIMITLNNLYINGFSWEELIRFNFKAKLLIGLLMVILFLTLTYLRLKHIFPIFDEQSETSDLTKVWHRLLHLPHEVFLAMLVFGVIVSPLYHLIDLWLQGKPPFTWDRDIWLHYLRDFLFEQSLTFTLAMLFYSLIRHHVRSDLLKLPIYHLKGVEWKKSFVQPLLLTFISIFLITVFSMMWYVLNCITLEKSISLAILFSIALITFIFGLFLFLLLTFEFKRELQLMIQGIRSLIGGNRATIHSKMPIISRDEIGQLAIAFNELQTYIAKEYADIEYELHLAYQVQQSLLPKEIQTIGPFQMYAHCQPMKEVGGDLYDIFKMDDGRFALLIGDVSGKGISAALIMSAMMVLFKTEMRQGGSAGQLLTRLNRLMVETLRGEMYVTLGLAIFDAEKNEIEYASAGHVAPYLMTNSTIEQILISSLPLGFAWDEEYDEVMIPYHPNDQFILYTDGLIEKVDKDGKFIGFERFEQFLEKLDGHTPLERQIQHLQQLLGVGQTFRYEDDQTIVIVKRVKREERVAQSFLMEVGGQEYA